MNCKESCPYCDSAVEFTILAKEVQYRCGVKGVCVNGVWKYIQSIKCQTDLMKYISENISTVLLRKIIANKKKLKIEKIRHIDELIVCCVEENKDDCGPA